VRPKHAVETSAWCAGHQPLRRYRGAIPQEIKQVLASIDALFHGPEVKGWQKLVNSPRHLGLELHLSEVFELQQILAWLVHYVPAYVQDLDGN
jgi:hypothetical protein